MASPADSASGTASAIESIDAFVAGWDGNDDGAPKVLGLVGFHADPRPSRWLLLAVDPGEGVLREHVLAGEGGGAARVVAPLPGQDLPELPLRRPSLKIDSDEALGIAASLAAEKGRAFATAHLHLRVREEGSEPVWLVAFHTASRTPVGSVSLSAESGAILRESWEAAAQPLRAAGAATLTDASRAAKP